jgi:hypothetical protein
MNELDEHLVLLDLLSFDEWIRWTSCFTRPALMNELDEHLVLLLYTLTTRLEL